MTEVFELALDIFEFGGEEEACSEDEEAVEVQVAFAVKEDGGKLEGKRGY